MGEGLRVFVGVLLGLGFRMGEVGGEILEWWKEVVCVEFWVWFFF